MNVENKDISVNLEQMQKIEFDILKYIKDVCDRNGVIYYLAYGTLIGAVRHSGFIPWDDDIDIHMAREEYFRFVEILKMNPHPYYKLVSRDTDKAFTAPLPKVIDTRINLIQDYGFIEKVTLGPYVDIFILQVFPDLLNL